MRIESYGIESAFLPCHEKGSTHSSFGWHQMKVFIDLKECEFQEGTRFIAVVNLIRETKKDEPMIKAIREKTGRSNIILFVLNGRVVQPQEYKTLEIKDGDNIRLIHPFAGG
jgi:thiamine biosynthesis protein ThiS